MLVIIVSLSGSPNALATHLKSVQIIVNKVPPCEGKEFKILLRFYINVNPSETNVHAGGGTLSFDDGASFIVPELQSVDRPDLGQFIGVAEFSINHVYKVHGVYKINYTEGDRNFGIINFTKTDLVPYSTFTEINTSYQCNSFPELLVAPVDRACVGAGFLHTPGAFDAEGDSLHFKFITPYRGLNQIITDYVSPISPLFYSNFQQGNEGGTGPPVLSLDSNNGLILWNAPGKAGEYVIAFEIEEWRVDRITGGQVLLSKTIRDMLVVVDNCPNNRPDLLIPDDLCIEAGSVISKEILGFDKDGDDVKIEFFSEIISQPKPPLISPSLIDFRSSQPADTIKFNWITDCNHVRDKPYQVVIKITDKPLAGRPLVTFKIWQIRIIAPAPLWKNLSLDLVKRKSVLSWEPYSCSNAIGLQVWRKVDHFNTLRNVCQTGIPKYSGYELIAQLSPNDSLYVDNNSTKGLVDGALYCYRLVAVFQGINPATSYSTAEHCIGPIRADAPVITHVSVEETNVTSGKIRVSWRSPFDIDKSLFPEPFIYEVYRGDGLSNEDRLTKVASIYDTTFLNNSLNTKDSVYNYRIVVNSKPIGYNEFIAVDTSATASSIKLEGQPGEGKIDLSWNSEVPWSNVISQSAYHNIYRGTYGDTNLSLLTRAEISESGFFYSDKSVDKNSYYCYIVETRGTYGNPKIDTLLNRSPRFCSYPNNDLVPCAPLLRVAKTNCEEFILQASCNLEFENKLNWETNSKSGCREDIVAYNLYATSNLADSVELIKANIKVNDFLDKELTSFARCYSLTAVDTRGVESELSALQCNDNCPVFELPNVFTPSVKDGCNDLFRAFNGISIEGDICSESPSCLRFIESVSFIVFDRWGKEVYSSSTSSGLSNTLDWEGKGSDGQELEGGVYYYKAEVKFDIIDQTRSLQTFKGWVNLIR